MPHPHMAQIPFKISPLCLSSLQHLTLLKYHHQLLHMQLMSTLIECQGMSTRSYCHMTLMAPFQRWMTVLHWQQREELSLSSSINPSLSARYSVKQGRILNKWHSMMHYLDCAPTHHWSRLQLFSNLVLGQLDSCWLCRVDNVQFLFPTISEWHRFWNQYRSCIRVHMGVGTGMDSHTCELSNKPWIIKNS